MYIINYIIILYYYIYNNNNIYILYITYIYMISKSQIGNRYFILLLSDIDVGVGGVKTTGKHNIINGRVALDEWSRQLIRMTFFFHQRKISFIMSNTQLCARVNRCLTFSEHKCLLLHFDERVSNASSNARNEMIEQNVHEYRSSETQ